ncbi:MAG: metalloprotease PmbA [Gammaproteobacteria bacterium RBG_16_51_14]|nr:MAG: metalloprotease PmbA [Gammaproteobacteria bacterium RBG_16_51_14]
MTGTDIERQSAGYLADLKEIIDQVLADARRHDATEAEVDIGTGAGLSVTVRMGEVDKLEHERDKALGVTVYMNGRKGSASTSDFSPAALRDTVCAACDIARHASRDEFAGLADPGLMAQSVPDLDLYHPWPVTPEQAIELAVECETMARDFDDRINNSDGAVVGTYSGTHAYGNTHGFSGGWEWSSHTIDCTMIAGDTRGMQRDGWYSRARDRKDLQDIRTIAQEAAKRTVSRLGARKLTTRSVPVIFEAPVASGLFSAFITAISGSSLYRRASFLLDKLGKPVFSDHIRIHEQPHLKKALGSAPFDDDGVATRARDIVRNGVLESYILSSYSARKLGMQTTGNAGGIHNLVVDHGELDLAGLIRKMDTGLLITDMIGFGVNQVTGDYSRGASGFWVEGGEICYPVEEITVAGNLVDMYQQIIETGNDVDDRGNVLTGSVLLANMIVAGD